MPDDATDDAHESKYPNGVSQDPFIFDTKGFHIDEDDWTPLESGKSLRRLLFPEHLEESARERALGHISLIDFKWIKAQMQYYDIHFDPDIDIFRAKALLVTSVAYGMCDVLPPQILEIKARLRAEYATVLNDYMAKRKKHWRQQVLAKVPNFNACSNPTEEARCDPWLFIQKYFLDQEGNPDRTKISTPVLLPEYIDKGLNITSRTDRVPGLYVADGGRGGRDSVMVVGWDREHVMQTAQEIDMDQTQGRGLLHRAQNWDRQMTMHQEHIETLRKRRADARQQTTEAYIEYLSHIPSKTFNTVGIYFARCAAVAQTWPTLPQVLGLRILSCGKLAIFDSMLESDSENDEADLIEESDTRRLYFRWRGYNTKTGEIQDSPEAQQVGHLEFADDEGNSFEGSIDMMGRIMSFEGYRKAGMVGPLTTDWHALSPLPSERAKAEKFFG